MIQVCAAPLQFPACIEGIGARLVWVTSEDNSLAAQARMLSLDVAKCRCCSFTATTQSESCTCHLSVWWPIMRPILPLSRGDFFKWCRSTQRPTLGWGASRAVGNHPVKQSFRTNMYLAKSKFLGSAITSPFSMVWIRCRADVCFAHHAGCQTLDLGSDSGFHVINYDIYMQRSRQKN